MEDTKEVMLTEGKITKKTLHQQIKSKQNIS